MRPYRELIPWKPGKARAPSARSVIDVSWNWEDGRFAGGAWVDLDTLEARRYRSETHFWRWVFGRSGDIWSHGWSQVDCLFAWPHLATMTKGVSTIPGKTVITPDRRLMRLSLIDGPTFSDSHHLLQVPVSDIARQLGYDIRPPSWKPVDQAMMDAQTVASALVKYFDTTERLWPDIRPRECLSASSLAMRLFRYRYLDRRVPQLSGRWIDRAVRASLYGGRMEVIREESIPAWYYDRSACYPGIAARGCLPAGRPALSGSRLYFDRQIDAWLPYCALIDADVPRDLKHGPLPVRDSTIGVVYPVGRLSGWYMRPEIEAAQSVGTKITFRAMIGWPETWDWCLPDMMRDLWTLRQTEAGYSRQVVKILMNSLIGKFGQKRQTLRLGRPRYERNGNQFPIDPELRLWAEPTDRWSAYMFPELTAWIQSVARAEMYLEMVAADDAVCYVDTDGLIADRPLDFESTGGMGSWRLDSEFASWSALGAKTWRGDDTIKIGGVNQAAQTIDPAEIYDRLKLKEHLNLIVHPTFRALSGRGSIVGQSVEWSGVARWRGRIAGRPLDAETLDIKAGVENNETARD